MKRTTSTNIFQLESVLPPELTAETTRLKRDAEKALLKLENAFTTSPCPACGDTQTSPAFQRLGYTYQRCQTCQTLYVAKRPTNDHLHQYYTKSPYGQFLASQEFQGAMITARAEQDQARADRVLMLRQRVGDGNGTVHVLTPKTTGLIDRLAAKTEVQTIPGPWENGLSKVNTTASVTAAFDVIERVPNIIGYLGLAVERLERGGRLTLSLRSGAGFDIAALWENADLSPVEHLNLLTPKGVTYLFNRLGLEATEISTPGNLDVQLIERARDREGLKLGRILEHLLDVDQFSKDEFQLFLQRALLSGHMIATGKKQ